MSKCGHQKEPSKMNMPEMVSSFPERLKEIMKEKGISARDLEGMTGISKSALYNYAKGIRFPKPITIEHIAAKLQVNPDWLKGLDVPRTGEPIKFDFPRRINQINKIGGAVKYPILGDVAVGYDHVAIEDWDGATVSIPTEYLRGRKKEEYFVLRVKGDSMYPKYLNGDLVLVLRQNVVRRSGSTAVVLYDNEMATLKRVEYQQGETWIKLIPENSVQYAPLLIDGPDLETFKILGVPVFVLRDVRD